MSPTDMNDVKQNPSAYLSLNPFSSDFRPLALIQIVLIPILFIGVLLRSPSIPDGYGSFHLDILYLYFAPLLLLVYGYYMKNKSLWLHVAQVSVLILITFILIRQHNLYIPARGRSLHVGLIFLLFSVYPLFGYNYLEFIKSRATYICAYLLLIGVYFFHVNQMSAGSTRASFVVYITLVFGLNLFFIPRYVSRNIFLAGTSIIAAISVLLGLLVYPIGEFNIFWLQLRLFSAIKEIPLLNIDFHFLQSFYSNPNILGALAFSGAFGSLVLLGESLDRKKLLPVPIIFGMFIINIFGMYLTYARASWLAFGVASVAYLGYLLLGRRAVQYIIILLATVALFLLGGILLSILPIETHGRGALWRAGLRAIYHAPSSFGYGLTNTHELIAKYVYVDQFRGYSPHNSYVQIFLNVGIVGGLAYLTIIVGSLVEGIIRNNSVDVPMLAFGLAFAIHQSFAVYTLFNNAVASLFATLVFGYLICGYER